MKKFIVYLLLIVFVGLAVFSAYEGFAVGREMKGVYQQLTDTYSKSKLADKPSYTGYPQFVEERRITYISTFAVFLLVFLMTLYAGPRIAVSKKLSQEEAVLAAKQIETDTVLSGKFLDAVDDVEESDEVYVDRLDVPKLLATELKKNCVLIKWEAVDYADGYFILRKRNNGVWTRIQKVSEKSREYADYTIRTGESYKYSVKAFHLNDDRQVLSGYDALGDDIYVEHGNKLDNPVLEIKKDSSGFPVLSWGVVEGSNYYCVMKKHPSDLRWKVVSRIDQAAALSYTDKELVDGETVVYAVSAVNIVMGRKIGSGTDNASNPFTFGKDALNEG